jgi:peptide/nickel transport system permease protein
MVKHLRFLPLALRRILIFVPTIFVVTLLAFGLKMAAPGDPAVKICGEEILLDPLEYERCGREHRLHLPAFYFSLKPASYPDTLHRVVRRYHRIRLKNQMALHGNWPPISAYDEVLQQLERAVFSLPDSVKRQTAGLELRRAVDALQTAYRPEEVQAHLSQLAALAGNSDALAELRPPIETLSIRYTELLTREQPARNYLPGFQWYGLQNQYHHWLVQLIRLDPGQSYTDRRPVKKKVGEALYWTILLNALSFFWAFALAIPIGVYAAVKRGKRFDIWSSNLLFMGYSLPRFWVATLLVVFFTTAEYGMNWFPSIGLGNLPPEAPFWSRFWERSSHLLLPVFCQTYALVAVIARHTRGGMLEILQEDYVRTARAGGLPERQVIWRHAFRNALFPLITLLAGIFPAAIAGSIVIEFIFSIPGMGSLTYDSILRGDWPVLFTILVAGAMLTMLGILVADILYAIADPRVRAGGTKHRPV